MKTIANSSFALALLLGAAVTGCAADVSDDPNDPNNPDPDVEPLPEDVDASGRYQIKSSIDLAQNAPGKAGEIARTFIDATNDADDPTSWILDQVINAMPSGTVKNLLQTSKPFVAGFLNDRLLDIAPDFVTTMLTLSNDFGEAATTFGLNEELEISKSGDGWLATHTVVGARFKINNVESEYAFADFSTDNVAVSGVGITVETTGKLTLADHTVNLQYGKVLRIALDGAIIPSLDPSSQNLADLFQNQVNCQAVAEAIDAAVRDAIVFSPGVTVFKTACTLGLQKGADLIYGKLAEIDGSALELGIAGTAKALDKDGNDQLDTIQSGTWAGSMSYAGTPATLTGATFFGARM